MYLKHLILTLILLATATGAERPNILFIAIDDLRPELGCYGAPQVKTLHIDKLAASGMRFERAYCQVPICMGSRASLMTGMLPTSKRFVESCKKHFHRTYRPVEVISPCKNDSYIPSSSPPWP